MGKTINHWGKWIDSDVPVTGVLSNNRLAQFISDESMNAIDLDYDAALAEFLAGGGDEEEFEFESQDDTLLIGDWKKDVDGLYMPDESGEYSAIVREDVTQVVWSKYTARGAVCSPCYPGQVDLDTPGEFLAYTLPPGAFDSDN